MAFRFRFADTLCTLHHAKLDNGRLLLFDDAHDPDPLILPAREEVARLLFDQICCALREGVEYIELDSKGQRYHPTYWPSDFDE